MGVCGDDVCGYDVCGCEEVVKDLGACLVDSHHIHIYISIF